MTDHVVVRPPRLVVTVLTASEAQPETIATLIERQQAAAARILYNVDLPEELVAPLHGVRAASVSPLSGGVQSSLLDVVDYWSAIDGELADSEEPVLVVRAGSWLPDSCWGRFYSVEAQGSRRLFPLSVRGECTSVFLQPDHQPGLAPQQIDHWLNHYCEQSLFDLPYAEGFTAFLRRPAGIALRENSCCDAVFVDDRHIAPRHLPEALPAAYGAAFRDRHPLTSLRHAMTELSQRGEQPPQELAQCRPINLHLSHGWGGGLWRWIDDFCAHDGHASNLILRPIGDRSAYAQTLVLVDAQHPQVPLLRKTLATPILSTAVSHSEYHALLMEICAQFCVSALYVSSLIGHSLDSLRTPIPTVLVLHNFFPICPAIVATFDGPCASCDDTRMADCFANNPRQQFFLSENQTHWVSVRQAFRLALAEGHLELIAPSHSVADRFSALIGPGESPPAHIIPHGLPDGDVPALEGLRELETEDTGRLRVVILGGQEAHKGGDLALSLVERLADVADFYLLGFGKELAVLSRHTHVQVLNTYSRDEFHEAIRSFRPHLGMLLSTVPETFSYTLSELNGAGIPALVTKLGAFLDRTEHGVNGWLAEPDAEALTAQVRFIDAHREELAAVHEQLRSSPLRTATAMVEDYRRVLPPVALAARGRPRSAGRPALADAGKLLVAEDTRYVEALRDFLAYSSRKLLNSPRIGDRERRALRKLLGG